MNNLRGIIEEEAIRGDISFARFMELVLYCPNIGYYEQLDVSPGRQGDFFTSVSVGSLFGELLAFQFADWLVKLPAGGRQLVEAGAHDGRLALDILNWLRQHRPELLATLEYWIMEPSAKRRQSQEKTLGDWAKTVRWFDSWEAVPKPGVNGVIFSNELLDAMPVHRLGWDKLRREWFEWGVSVREGRFVWARMPLAAGNSVVGAVAELPPELLEVLPDGFTTEVNPAAVCWWQEAARTLGSGKLLGIDYGLAGEQFFVPERKEGTARAYYRQHVSSDLLARPGEQDITAQVNFTAVQEAGEAEGLTTEAYQSQAQFLSGIAQRIEASGESFGAWSGKQARQFQTLTHPEHLGRAFRVLLQSR
ncbi:MAG: hypothetical protein JWR19_206 [Pedosphaera sp.]|nr:hypothetical protein [Pedosphaera sp.]